MEENKVIAQYTDSQLYDMQEEQGTLPAPTEEELIAEALKRMQIWGYWIEARKRFEREGVVLKSETKAGIVYELDEEEQRLVNEFEQETGGKVYACIRNRFRFWGGEEFDMLSCLYVSAHYSEWRADRESLAKPIDSNGAYEVLARVINLTDHMLSDTGYIHIAHTAGGGYQRRA